MTSKKAAKKKSPASKKGKANPPSTKVISEKSQSAKSKKKLNPSVPRSSRVTHTLKRLPAADSARKKIWVEPLSQALPQVEMISDLPFSYNKTELVLLVRDPYWAYTYWDFSSETWNGLIVFRERNHDAKPKLRVHNLDQGTFYDMDIYLDAKNWYVDLGIPDTTFQLELGFLDSSGQFHRIALSNKMKTPRNGPSEKIDPNWELSDFESWELYRLSGGGRTGAGSEIFSSMRRPK